MHIQRLNKLLYISHNSDFVMQYCIRIDCNEKQNYIINTHYENKVLLH